VKTSQPEEEQELLALARTNDKQAIAALYDRYAMRIYSYLYRRIGDAQVAEDLTGDVFVKVLEAIRSQRVWRLSFQGWLYRIAHNVAVDWFRSHQSAGREPLDGLELAGDTPEPGAYAAESWSYEELRRAMLALPEAQQQVLVLRFGEGFKTREVAKILGKSVGAVEALQHRALSALKDSLDD
jgi:RNA polymerase sigma-70 factor, ECF subfamily